MECHSQTHCKRESVEVWKRASNWWYLETSPSLVCVDICTRINFIEYRPALHSSEISCSIDSNYSRRHSVNACDALDNIIDACRLLWGLLLLQLDVLSF